VIPAPWRSRTPIQILEPSLPVWLIENFISDAEAGHLVFLADQHFARSRVVCTKPEGCVDEARTSETSFLDSDDVTRRIQNRAKLFSGYPRCEPLQAVRYGAGQEYKPHFDAFDKGSVEGRASICSSGGRRAATILVYLNTPQSGGATVFPNLGLEVEARKRAGVYWKNLLPSGEPDPRAFHGGAPVKVGIKYALNVWLVEPEPAVRC
jgi:prolyl 4-hydroxylase